MILNLDLINIFIVIIAAINIAYGAVIFLKDKKSATNITFFFLAFTVGLWGIAMFLFRSSDSTDYATLFARLLYSTATLIPFSFVYFSEAFPKTETRFNLFQKYVLPIFLLFIVYVSFLPNLLITGTQFFIGQETHISFNLTYHTIYVAYINLIFGYGYYLLLRKYLESRNKNSILNKQVVYIVGGTFVSTMIGVSTNLFGPYLGIFDFNWAGQIGNVVMISAIAYAILKYNLFNIKLVLVELAVLLLNMFLLFNVFTSHTTIDTTVNVAIFAGIFVFSIFLMRGIYKDIRDREQIEILAKEMEIANERLSMMEGQKTEFVSIASHQLRTPLTVIKGYASMILEGTFGDITVEIRDAIEKLYKSSERIVALVEDLLTVSRIEQGRMMLNFEVIDFKFFVEQTIFDTQEEIDDSKLEFSFTTKEPADFRVSIDEKKFRQVVQHLLENAIKYTKAPGKIHIALEEDEVIKKIRLAISDTGSGMTPAQIHSVFERFNLKSDIPDEKTEESTATSPDEKDKIETAVNKKLFEQLEDEKKMLEKRTPGIGLYIAQEIIEAHKGELRIESSGVNRGTTVIVELPKVG